MYLFSKVKALYKACGEVTDGIECNKKVIDNGDGTYRCEKCMKEKDQFKWRIMLQMNIADSTDNIWATSFQVLISYGAIEISIFSQETAEKILGVSSADLGRYLESDEDQYNAVFSEATFKTYNFRLRVKEDTWNDETRLKHTVSVK